MPCRRCFVVVIATLALIAVAAGVPPVRQSVLTAVPPLAVPAAAGLPVGVPPVWLPGELPLLFWVADIAGFGAMMLVAVSLLWRLGATGRGAPRLRAWARIAGTCAVAVMVAGMVRMVIWSLATEPNLMVYLGSLVATAVLSLLIGLAIGVLLGFLGLLVNPNAARSGGRSEAVGAGALPGGRP